MSTIEAISLAPAEEFRNKMAEFEKMRRELDGMRKGAIADLLKKRKDFVAQQEKERKEFMKASTLELRQLGYEPSDGESEKSNGHEASPVADPFAPIFATTDKPKLQMSPEMREAKRQKQLAWRQRTGRAGNGTRGRSTGSAKFSDTTHCPICEINGHDARAHRGQEKKRPFTRAELIDRGYSTKED